MFSAEPPPHLVLYHVSPSIDACFNIQYRLFCSSKTTQYSKQTSLILKQIDVNTQKLFYLQVMFYCQFHVLSRPPTTHTHTPLSSNFKVNSRFFNSLFLVRNNAVFRDFGCDEVFSKCKFEYCLNPLVTDIINDNLESIFSGG